MVHGRVSKGLVLLFVHSVTAIAIGAPTLESHDNVVVAHVLSSQSDGSVGLGVKAPCVAGLGESPFAAIATEFHTPSVRSYGFSIPGIDVKSMPAVPGTLLMVLVGFLCVTLVRDRRVWLAGLLGLLWAGQTGISLLPHLASCMIGRKQSEQRFSSSNYGWLWEPEYTSRQTDNVEGTYRPTLLGQFASARNGGTSVALSGLLPLSRSPKTSDGRCVYDRDIFGASVHSLSSSRNEAGLGSAQSAIVRLASLSDCTVKYATLRTRRPICLSTAFGGRHTARGPPGSNCV